MKSVKTKKAKNHLLWLILGIIGVCLAAPNATVVRYTITNGDPYVFNAARFTLVALLTTPYLFKYRKLFTAKNVWHSLWAGLFMAIAVISYVWAIKMSQASYVSIITLLSPILFVLLAVKFDHGKITRRVLAGISLAALGALTVVALPVALAQNQPFVFYPSATILALVNCVAFPLAILAYKKADDHGIPMLASFSLSSWVVLAINIVISCMSKPTLPTVSVPFVLGVIYSGIAVALLSRIINVRSYEILGVGTTSILSYLENLMAVILPVIILGEKLSTEMIAGGMLILTGVYIVEHHKGIHHKHRLHIHAR